MQHDTKFADFLNPGFPQDVTTGSPISGFAINQLADQVKLQEREHWRTAQREGIPGGYRYQVLAGGYADSKVSMADAKRKFQRKYHKMPLMLRMRMPWW